MNSMVEYFRNLPCYRLSLACGDSVLIALQGAQVLSWVSQGRERLFLSPNNKFDGHTPFVAACQFVFPNSTNAAHCQGMVLPELWIGKRMTV